MMKPKGCFVLRMALSISLLLLAVVGSASEKVQKKSVGLGDTRLTPVVMSVLSEPHPVWGSDSLIHFVYELHVTNATSFSVKVEQLEVLDATQPEKVLAAFSGNVIPQKMQGLITKSPTNRLEAGEGASIFIHFTMERIEAQPVTLAHRLTISGEFPPGSSISWDCLNPKIG